MVDTVLSNASSPITISCLLVAVAGVAVNAEANEFAPDPKIRPLGDPAPDGPCTPCAPCTPEPWKPCAPSGPWLPCAPVPPFGPCAPCVPEPWKPCGPSGPCGPWNPVTPGFPCVPCAPWAPVPAGPCAPWVPAEPAEPCAPIPAPLPEVNEKPIICVAFEVLDIKVANTIYWFTVQLIAVVVSVPVPTPPVKSDGLVDLR